MRFRHPILCQHCFRRFTPTEAYFLCRAQATGHAIDPHNPESGNFAYHGFNVLYDVACCATHGTLTPYRICRHCKQALPHFAGQQPATTIAISGDRGNGKTMFAMGLVARLMHRSGNSFPGLTPMFEDHDSQFWFQELYGQLVLGRSAPRPTTVAVGRDPPPICVRLYGGRTSANRHAPVSFLTIFDPPGELFHSGAKLEYVRYLATASTLVLTIDPHPLRNPSRSPAGARSPQPVHILNWIVNKIRGELGIAEPQPLPVRLCVMLTKCDEHLFDQYSDLRPVAPPDTAGVSRSSRRRFLVEKRTQLDATQARCQSLLREWGHHQFVNMASHEFRSCHYFACSVVRKTSAYGPPVLEPVGVEDFLYRALLDL